MSAARCRPPLDVRLPAAHKRLQSLGLLASAAALLPAAAAQSVDDGPDARFGWLAFGDAYYMASHHTDTGDGAAGVVLRRLYLTLDIDFAEHWFARIRSETNQAGEFETYSFETDFKDAYVGREFNGHRFLFGLAPTPTFDLIESVWGLRYLARTPMDLQGIASRDTGVSLQGPLTSSGNWSYRSMIGAGLEFGNESGDGRKVMAAATWRPAGPWLVDFYVDDERLEGPSDRRTWQVFAGYETPSLRWGAQYSNQDRETEARVELASAFVVRPVRERLSLIGRVDRLFEPSPKAENIAYIPYDATATATTLLAAVEVRMTPRFVITPNVVYTYYDRNEAGLRPDNDTHLRVTFFLDLE